MCLSKPWCPYRPPFFSVVVESSTEGTPAYGRTSTFLSIVTLGWLALFMTQKWKWKSSLTATPWTVVHWSFLSTGFSRQEYCSGLPFSPNPGIEPRSSVLQADSFFFFFNFSFYFILLYTIVLVFHILTWIHHGCTCVPKHEPPFYLPPHNIPLGHPRAPAPSILYPALDIDWWFVSYMILYIFHCNSPKSSHPLPLPQSPKVCSIHLCLFCCLTYRVIVTIFLNSIYMC